MLGPVTAKFGNTFQSQGFDFTFSPGLLPSVCNLYTIPHVPTLPSVADLTIENVGQSPLVFRDCLLAEPSLSAGVGGKRWRLPILDRRWRWQTNWAPVYGHYNIRKPDGTYTREKTPQELAGLLLDELIETNYDVSLLPNDARPKIHWDGDAAVGELSELLSSLSCTLAYNPFTDTMKVWPVGQGNPLPAGSTTGKTFTPVIPAQPSSMIVEAGPTLWQATFKVEPVGEDTDGVIKPIEDLSYKPADGWGLSSITGEFPGITGTFQRGGVTYEIRDLARAWIWRGYRVTEMAHGGFTLPNIHDPTRQPTSVKDLQFFNTLVEDEISPVDGGLRPIPCRVYARWFESGRKTQAKRAPYDRGFSFDTQTGIIRFGDLVYLIGNLTSQIEPADMRFETSFHAGSVGILDRWDKEYDLSTTAPSETPPRIIQRRDTKARIILRYDDTDNFTTVENTADVEQRLTYYGDAALAEYGQRNGETANYAGLLPIIPDGLTLQVSWSGGGGRGPTTRASQAQRHNRYLPSLDEQGERLRTAQAAEKGKRVLVAIGQGLEFIRTLGGAA